MSRVVHLVVLLLVLCCCLADEVAPRRLRRGTRIFREYCFDSSSTALRARGETWLRWRGQQADFCMCVARGRERCHSVPVITCYISYCYNGGTCKEAVHSSDFLCQCPPGFSGPRCEINTTESCIVGKGESYRGTWSISRTGTDCINWNSTTLRGKKYTAMRPEASTLGLGNHNFCRNPDKDAKPWCYVYKGIHVEWQYCQLPTCPADPTLECVMGKGEAYRGTASVTKEGHQCLPWDLSPVKRKLYNAWRSDARQLGLGSHSFCRNPDGDPSPWCHVYKGSKLTWDYCDIPKCGARPSTAITTLGPRGHSTISAASCGQRQEKTPAVAQFRIRGGQESDISAQPWQVAITVYRPRSKAYAFLCGGVLIDSCWVLSAAHCFQENFSAGSLQVVLGRTFRVQNSSSEQIFGVEKYWVNEQYDDNTYDNDIVLLKLQTDVGMCATYTPEVLPACLPDPSLELPDWTECEISGYGKEEEFSPFYSDRVKRGHVRLWPQSQCVPEKLANRLVTPNMLCAGDTRGLDDACKGDSGGPLVCPKDGRMILLGLISWGDGCGKKDTPGVYTRVTRYLNWIAGKMKAYRN